MTEQSVNGQQPIISHTEFLRSLDGALPPQQDRVGLFMSYIVGHLDVAVRNAAVEVQKGQRPQLDMVSALSLLFTEKATVPDSYEYIRILSSGVSFYEGKRVVGKCKWNEFFQGAMKQLRDNYSWDTADLVEVSNSISQLIINSAVRDGFNPTVETAETLIDLQGRDISSYHPYLNTFLVKPIPENARGIVMFWATGIKIFNGRDQESVVEIPFKQGIKKEVVELQKLKLAEAKKTNVTHVDKQILLENLSSNMQNAILNVFEDLPAELLTPAEQIAQRIRQEHGIKIYSTLPTHSLSKVYSAAFSAEDLTVIERYAKNFPFLFRFHEECIKGSTALAPKIPLAQIETELALNLQRHLQEQLFGQADPEIISRLIIQAQGRGSRLRFEPVLLDALKLNFERFAPVAVAIHSRETYLWLSPSEQAEFRILWSNQIGVNVSQLKRIGTMQHSSTVKETAEKLTFQKEAVLQYIYYLRDPSSSGLSKHQATFLDTLFSFRHTFAPAAESRAQFE